MPELPEVNTFVVALDHHLKNERFAEIQRLSPKLRQPLPDSKQLAKLLEKPIKRVFRQAKSIFFDFGRSGYLHIHLGMTGFFRLKNNPGPAQKHEHMRFLLKNGFCLSFFDSRRFGLIQVLKALPPRVPEPFKDDLDVAYLENVCRSNRLIKVLIMDQAIIAGIGNIYASEALFAAGIRPDRQARSLGRAEIEKLHRSMLQVIDRAVKAGIKSLLPDYKLDENTGHFEICTDVYGRSGEICPKCRKTEIHNIVLTGRSSFFCSHCQK